MVQVLIGTVTDSAQRHSGQSKNQKSTCHAMHQSNCVLGWVTLPSLVTRSGWRKRAGHTGWGPETEYQSEMRGAAPVMDMREIGRGGKGQYLR